MNELSDYALVTTIAVVLLAIGQIIFLIVITVLGLKILNIVRDATQTVSMGKEFVTSLREQQRRDASLFKLGIFAMKQFGRLRRKKR